MCIVGKIVDESNNFLNELFKNPNSDDPTYPKRCKKTMIKFLSELAKFEFTIFRVLISTK